MAFRMRKSKRFGWKYLHIKVNITQRGYSSWSVKIGPWSRNYSKTQVRTTFDLPGPFFHTSSRKREGRPGGKTPGGKTGKSKESAPVERETFADRLQTARSAWKALFWKIGNRFRQWRERRTGPGSRHHFGPREKHECMGHKPPMQFDSKEAFDAHFLTHLGGGAAGTERVLPKKTPPGRATRPPSRRRPRGGRPKTRAKQGRLERLLQAWKPQIDQYRSEVKVNVMARGMNLDDLGVQPRGVNEIRERMIGLEQLGQRLQETMDEVLLNWPRAGIDPEVLAYLKPLAEAGELISAAGTRTMAAFEERYADDIRAAQAGERVDNDLLTR